MRYTIFLCKMNPIVPLFVVEREITIFELLGVFSVLKGGSRVQSNIFNTCSTSATPIFDFQVVSNFKIPIKIYWGIY